MSGRGLLSRLTANRPADPIPELESIIHHLKVLLNTCIGDSPCAEAFGIVDFVDIMHDFPVAVQILQRSIRSTIVQYEPRLTNINVRAVMSDDPMILCFEITGRLADDSRRGVVRLRTELASTGRINVS